MPALVPSCVPAVSVLVPYRDSAATIEEALESVLAQRGVTLELLAVDDGSSDDGPARVARMASRDRRIVPLASGGVGIAPALAQALTHARAPLVARMDSDDVSLPDRLVRQLEALAAEPGLAAVGTRVEGFPDAALGDGLRRYIAWQNAIVTPADHAREIFVESPLCNPSTLIRRAALEQVGGWRDESWAEDYDLWLRLDAAGLSLAKVPEVLLRWRHRPGRVTFTDPRCAPMRFYDAKARYLAPRLRGMGRPIAIWGAGKTGKRLTRALAACALVPELFVDIDPLKVGRLAQGRPIIAPAELTPRRHTIVVAVGARGAREIVRARLQRAELVEGIDFICAA